MTAIAKAFVNVIPAISPDIDILKCLSENKLNPVNHL